MFNGLVTNRSPLRGVLPSLYEQFYKLSYGDVMIAGSNVEVSNRLTLIRRPGNPIFDDNTWNDIQSFDEFPVNKAASDAFGTTLEEIFTMVSQPGALYATLNGTKQLVFADSAAQGQTYMQPIGNSLYFSNGIDNKKWLQSLISWAANFELQGTDGLSGTYPFYSTYMLTGNIYPYSDSRNIQQFIGVAAANITEVEVSDGVLKLTINNSGIPNTTGQVFPLDSTTPTFQIWGCNTATWLNGALITALEAVTLGTTTTVKANYVAPKADQSYGPTADTGYLQQIGTTPVVAITGTSTPAWATPVANTDDNWGATSPTGNIILDGNVLWVNRGASVENWGIQAPDTAPTTSEENSTTTGWKASTYFSAPGIVVIGNNIWQATTEGTTGASDSGFPGSPSIGSGAPLYTGATTYTDGTVVWRCVGNTSSTVWDASTDYGDGTYAGAYPWTGTTTIDGVTYPDGQFLPDWKSGAFVIANASGTPSVFMLQRNIPFSDVNVPISSVYGGGAYLQTSSPYTTVAEGWTAAFFNHAGYGGPGGIVDLSYGGSTGNPVSYGTSTPAAPTANATGLSSLMWNFYTNGTIQVAPMQLDTVTAAGEAGVGSYTTPWPGSPSDAFEFLQWGRIRIPVPGMNITFTINASDAAWFGIEASAGATYVSGSTTTYQGLPSSVAPGNSSFGGRTLTPWNGYPIMGGWNGANNGQTMSITINFPNAGVYGIEFCYGKNSGGGSYDHVVFFCTANGSLIVPEAADVQPFLESSTTTPPFGSAGFSTTPAAQNSYVSALENSNNAAGTSFGAQGQAFQGNQLAWYNLGPVTSFAWPATTPVTLPSTLVIDTNSNEERSYESGVSGTTQPTWQSSLYAITQDTLAGGTLSWINEGAIPAQNNTPGTITATSTQGWIYWIALVNTLDQTVSNLSPASLGTGPIIAGNITIPAGSGIDITTLDPQVDYVAIFRTTDNGSTPLLVPGLGNTYWTLPITTYLQNGYIDTTADIDLDTEVEGAEAGENTPPITGAVNLSYHLSRGWYSIGNIVYYTSGPTAPSGNGNGTSPLNFDTLPSRVVRLVPTAIGMLVMTVSDMYIIAGNGTSSNPILPAVPYLQGVGLANYNALDINGALIGFSTTDKQFLIFDPSAGLNYAGYPIGDQLRLNNGQPGQSWVAADTYVAWYTNGEDQAWFLGDGQFGWYKLIATPAPENVMCWSPFATIAGSSISAIAAIETSPGVHNLLIGPSGSGNIFARNLNATTDGGSGISNGTAYKASAVFGSYILALPGQIAKIAFITTNSVRVGSPLIIGLLFNEALPYFQGSFDILKRWEPDPPNVPQSKSFYKQRFYMAEDHEQTAYCTDLQFLIQWPAEAAMNELNTFSIWGAYEVEA